MSLPIFNHSIRIYALLKKLHKIIILTVKQSMNLNWFPWNPMISLVLQTIVSYPALSIGQNSERVSDRTRHCTVYFIQNENTKKKYITAHVGDAKFWKAIDSTLDNHEIEKVQRQIKDEDPTNFELKGKVRVELQFDSSGNVVDVHPNQ